MDSSGSDGTDVIRARVDDFLGQRSKRSLNLPLTASGDTAKWRGVTMEILTGVMYIQWIIMAFIISYLMVRLSDSSDENWIGYMVSLVVLLLLLLPILFIKPCCSCRGEEEPKVSRYFVVFLNIYLGLLYCTGGVRNHTPSILSFFVLHSEL